MLSREPIIYCINEGYFLVYVEKDESLPSKSIEKAFSSSFNFDMGNVGYCRMKVYTIHF